MSLRQKQKRWLELSTTKEVIARRKEIEDKTYIKIGVKELKFRGIILDECNLSEIEKAVAKQRGKYIVKTRHKVKESFDTIVNLMLMTEFGF